MGGSPTKNVVCDNKNGGEKTQEYAVPTNKNGRLTSQNGTDTSKMSWLKLGGGRP